MRSTAFPFERSIPVSKDIIWNPNTVMRPQLFDWDCAAAGLAWVLRATGLDPYATEQEATELIGMPQNINPVVGLVDGSGKALQAVLLDYGQSSKQAWLGFDEVYDLVQHTTGQMSGAAWYHWVALRGTSGSDLWIANSAPGYKGVWDILSRADFARLGGFSVVWLTTD